MQGKKPLRRLGQSAAFLTSALAKQGHARIEQRSLCESVFQLSWLGLTLIHMHTADTEIACRAGCHDLPGFRPGHGARVLAPACASLGYPLGVAAGGQPASGAPALVPGPAGVLKCAALMYNVCIAL